MLFLFIFSFSSFIASPHAVSNGAILPPLAEGLSPFGLGQRNSGVGLNQRISGYRFARSLVYAIVAEFCFVCFPFLLELTLIVLGVFLEFLGPLFLFLLLNFCAL